MAPRSRARVAAVCGAAAVFAVASFLPIWTAWYFSDWEACGHPSSLWGTLAELLANQRKRGLDANFLWRLHERNLLTAGIVLVLAGLSGWAIFRARVRPPRTEVASDYQEGPDGSLRDGRG